MKDAYTEISIADFEKLSHDKQHLIMYMAIKNQGKKNCKDCKTRLKVAWIIVLGSPVLGFLIAWLGWLTTK